MQPIGEEAGYMGEPAKQPQVQEEEDEERMDFGSEGDNFKVVVRVRPPLPREIRGTGLRPYQCTTHVEPSGRIITLSENLPAVLQGAGGAVDPGMLYATYRFTFDHVYDQASSQEQVYMRSAQHVVLSILQGYNSAIIAYGQTGTGKTYTMEGDLVGPNRGIIPRTVEDVFTAIVNDPEPTSKYLVRASYLQIYNENISDLLKPERTNLVIREDRRRGVFVEGLSEWVVRSPAEVYQLMERGQALRATGATKLNEVSSRSHAVCIIIVEKCTTSITQGAPEGAWNPRASGAGRPGAENVVAHSIKVGKLNLVDLAGSERVHVTGAVGRRLEESKKINASLSALGNVIAALTDRRGERTHIPYRDSKLTRILEDSLGGNCRTTMICTIAPSMDAFQESLSTLKFANRAKSIKNEAHVNEDLDQRTLLRKYERELRRLRAELQRRSKELVDKRALLEVEEQKRRAEADKLAALTALEKRSREFMREKEEKRALEAKIAAMQSQLLGGGMGLGLGPVAHGGMLHGGSGGAAGAGAASLEDVPAFKQLLAKEHRRIRGEYEARLRELESERQMVEEDRQQVDRYKQLLLKQRDIMIALTARLNERDEQIMALQEELEAYDRYQRQLEDALDSKTAELFALRKAAVEAAAGSPLKGGAGAAGGPGSQLATLLGAWGAGAGEAGGGSGNGPPSDTRQVADNKAGAEAHGATEVGMRLPSGHLNGSASMQGSELDFVGAAVPGSAAAQQQMQLASMQQQLAAQASLISRLTSENLVLQQQMDQNVTGPQSNGHNQHQQHRSGSPSGDSEEQVAVLQAAGAAMAAACVGADKERAALRQILESKVRRMVGDVARELAELAEVSASQGLPLDPGAVQAVHERLLAKVRTTEGVLDKIGDAIRSAPPILPAGLPPSITGDV